MVKSNIITITVNAPKTIQPFSYSGPSKNPNIPDYQPLPIMPNLNFYSPGVTGFQLETVSSDGYYYYYRVTDPFYGGNGLYFGPNITLQFPVDYSDPIEVQNSINANNSAWQSFYNLWNGAYNANPQEYSGAETVISQVQSLVNQANSYIQSHAQQA